MIGACLAAKGMAKSLHRLLGALLRAIIIVSKTNQNRFCQGEERRRVCIKVAQQKVKEDSRNKIDDIET